MTWQFPEGATRIKVTDELGKKLWRKISDLKDTDQVIINPKNSEPYYMYGQPGKPNIKGQVTNTVNSNIDQIRSRKQSHLKKDSIYRSTSNNPDSSDVLTNVIIGLAEESASLAFERLEAERKGESTSNISVRRVNALKAVGDTWLKKKEILTNKSIDLDSNAFKIVFGHIAETFRKACDESELRPEMTETIFANFGKLVDEQDWINEVKTKMEKG